MTARQAALKVGVDPATLIRWIEMGEGPPAFIKAGPKRRVIRIRPEDFDRWVRDHTRGRLTKEGNT